MNNFMLTMYNLLLRCFVSMTCFVVFVFACFTVIKNKGTKVGISLVLKIIVGCKWEKILSASLFNSN